MPSPATVAAVWSAKAAAIASRLAGRGGGTAVAGLVGLRLQPHLIRELSAGLGHGSLLVTGTNGKTTTSRLIAAAARAAGLDPLANASGSNLMRGLASTFALESGLTGTPSNATRRLGVLEVDEATVPHALPELRPRVAVFLNLFRDQLDRYGEVEAVAAIWREMLATTPDLHLVLNADDPSVASLGDGRAGVAFFGVDDPRLDRGAVEHASDALACVCGARLQYDVAYFGHLGHWRCAACGRARPALDILARDVDLRDGRSLSFRLVTPQGDADVEMPLGGLYNVYNALGATAGALAVGLPLAAITRALTATDAAFGRQEAFEIGGKRVELYLAKNPAGLNQVLSTLLLDQQRRSAMFLLSDGIADGRDISWIWDADFEVAAGQFENVVVSGTRAEELALRLKYAEWTENTLAVEPDIEAALAKAIAATPIGQSLTIVPTYTAMLEVRASLATQAGRAQFWQAERQKAPP